MTEATRNLIYNKIFSELNGLAQNVVANFQGNMTNRENNPFLVFGDVNAQKYMALGRSIDSQLGNRMQRIIFFFARMRYGTQHVPNIVEINITDCTARNIECVLYSVNCDLPITEQNKGFNPYNQYVYINKNSTEKKIKSVLKIKTRSTALNKFIYVFNGVSQEVLDFLVEKNNEVLPVDLLFFNCPTTELNGAAAFEIKMGGNLDTKNAKSNAEEVKSLSDLFGFLTDHSAYFATCYGECSAAVRSDLEAILGNDAICNNRTFWDKIIPSGDFTYEDFIEVYAEAFRATHLEETLGNL